MKRIYCATIVLGAAFLLAHTGLVRAAESPGVVSHVLVLSNHVEDVSSLEAWKRSFIKDDMDEKAKAIAVWTSVVKFRHQSGPPNEYLNSESNVHDPIKSFNVYGGGMCCCASANLEALARYVGLEARGWGITQHSVPEIRINGHWSMLDGSLVNYFQEPDGTIAGVEELNKNIIDWMAQHPEFQGAKGAKALYKFMLNGGWRNGPAMLAGSISYDDNGWLPAHTHNWSSSVSEFGGAKNFLFEYGVALGYEVNIQLRPGEKLVRNWGNIGLEVNQLEGGGSGLLGDSPQNAKGDMRYAPKYGDLTNGRIGNGTLEYDLPLADGTFRGGMLTVDNLAAKSEDGSGPALHVKDPAQSGVLIFRMPTSYVYLSGELTYTAVVGSGGSIAVSFSDNNGLDWKEISNVTVSGPQTVDLKPLVYRRYDYRLKFELKGKGTGLDAVKVTHDIQHSQRPLPILDKGDNQITFSAGKQEGTITVEGALKQSPKVSEKKNLMIGDFHPIVENLAEPSLTVQGTTGSLTVPIQAPGDIKRLRVGIHYRARKAEDSWSIAASFDEGKTFVPVATLPGPVKAISRYLTFDQIPPGVRSMQMRITGTQHLDAEGEQQRLAGIDMAAESRLLDLRLDADYQEPHGGFAPVKVTYAYQENGQEKTDVHIARSAEEAYTIHCDEKPVMKSITLELAGQ